jgi:hypothetical protein
VRENTPKYTRCGYNLRDSIAEKLYTREKSTMTDIFISYSRKDEPFARQLAQSLSELGADVWIDVEDIPVGLKWSTAIQQGLDVCQAMIVIISPESMASVNVEDEWQYFIDQKKIIIPVFYRNAKIHFQLSRIQYINFENVPYDLAFRRLYSALISKGITLKPLAGAETTTATDIAIPAKAAAPPAPAGMDRRVIGGIAAAGVIAVIVALIALTSPPPPDITPTITRVETQNAVLAPTTTPSATLTASATFTRTRRPVLSNADRTATEEAGLIFAETDIALTETAEVLGITAPTLTAQQATDDAFTMTAESFTDTPTPNYPQTVIASRATRTQNAIASLTQAALPTLTPTPPATNTATPPATLTVNTIECPDALPTRLNQGMRVVVLAASEGEIRRNQNIREMPNGTVITTVPEGTNMYITGQPECAGGFVWYPIETADGSVRGWTAEGSLPDEYFLVPIFP